MDIDILHLGGPELCQDNFPSNFTFDDKRSPQINITLCGVPQPKVQGTFNRQNLSVLGTTVNSYTHTFTLQLPQLTQTECGKELTIIATENNHTLTYQTKIFVENCKYDYYIHYILVLRYFLEKIQQSFRAIKRSFGNI